MVTSNGTRRYGEAWLVDSGCTNHTTPYFSNFNKLDQSYKPKVKIGNGDLIDVEGKRVVVETPTGIKYISDVLFVP